MMTVSDDVTVPWWFDPSPVECTDDRFYVMMTDGATLTPNEARACADQLRQVADETDAMNKARQ